MPGLDSFVQQSAAKNGSIVLRLVKGPSETASADPVDSNAPKLDFPMIAKFPPNSVVKPDLKRQWKDGRWYQQNVPKAVDDSDEEEGTNKKRRRRNDAPQRQWIFQERVDFLETMVARREKRANNNNSSSTNTTSNADNDKISSRYEGVPEHTPSHYTVWQLQYDKDDEPTILVSPVPSPNGIIVFSQPAARKTYSLTQAEHALEDAKSGNMIRSMHNKGAGNNVSRLMQKLQQLENNNNAAGQIEEGDDVMADVAFRKRKVGGARKELLDTLGDGVAVAADGTIGGTNDRQFAGNNKFGTYSSNNSKNTSANATSADKSKERGADGAAMADDFYQRDVQAEYEELDYNANEQFDDDDVDMNENEVQIDNSQANDDNDENQDDDLDDEYTPIGGAEGLASVAGFKAMLAKARGEVPNTNNETAVTNSTFNSNTASAANSDDESADENDHMAKIMAAADKASKNKKGGVVATSSPESAIQVDENGLRVITLEAVRREIWLNHGQIPIKRLMKLFDVKKKSAADRQATFRDVVKELCTMKSDPVGGKMLVLKQHYSNMG